MSAGRPLSKRIPKEIADAQAEAMRSSNIYYWADDADMRKGKAMIVGPEGTPYEGCPLIFHFQLPDDYPFNPPSVQILTSDGETRLHPNLYVAGKVCLSILGTWSGPKWSPVMTLSTVLSSIQSLLEENPITNEPGYEKLPMADPRAKGYAEFVRMRLVERSMVDLARWKGGACPPAWQEFRDVLGEIGGELYEKLYLYVKGKAVEEGVTGSQMYTSPFYSMRGESRWRRLCTLVEGAAAAKQGKIVAGEES
jgi:ubiquitin-protein ligase